MTTKIITVQGVDFEVEFDYTAYRAATFTNPAEGGEVDILAISIEGYELSALLHDSIVERIKYELETLIPQLEYEEMICAAESREEERRERALIGE